MEAQILWLGALQGLTEFLPVSSSAHLALLPQWFHWKDQGQSVDVFLNLGTVAVLIFFLFPDLCAVCRGGCDTLRGRATAERTQCIQILLATLPVIVVGGLVEALCPLRLNHPVFLATITVIFSLILFFCDRRPTVSQHHPWRDALLIGGAQVFALLPGASRLGVCLSIMRYLGYDRITSFRFSLLLSLPPVLGALTLKGLKVLKTPLPWSWLVLLGGCLTAFLCGKLVLKGMFAWLKRGGTWTPFVLYRLLLAVAMMML
ncbi:MAG: undecaprenyl-diphosphate phosphatase [Holosporales bacterium]|jgi:undecaprenyl-diphosphatase|nr:undecaprenyl-diphosphate phosphatase [Holosporales bacterium]